MFVKIGISVHQMMKLTELEKCVELGYLPFAEKGVRNLLHSFRKLDPEESLDLSRMCRSIKDRESKVLILNLSIHCLTFR